MDITLATTDDERAQVQALFDRTFDDLAPNAVPMVANDPFYAPLVAQVHDGSGTLVAAALTCRAQLAAGSITVKLMHDADPLDYGPVLDLHSELMLIAVDTTVRGTGVGHRLLAHLEGLLADRGVRAWFGHVPTNLDADRLRRFCSGQGFRIVPDGEPLPELLGRRWVAPNVERPAFSFYKRPRRAASDAAA